MTMQPPSPVVYYDRRRHEEGGYYPPGGVYSMRSSLVQSSSSYYSAAGGQQQEHYSNKQPVKKDDKPTQKVPARVKRKAKRSKDMPKRPLSAYNFFFAHERKRHVENGNLVGQKRKKGVRGKIGFAGLARQVAARWKELDEDAKKVYDGMALQEQRRYKVEITAYRETKRRFRGRRDEKYSPKPQVVSETPTRYEYGNTAGAAAEDGHGRASFSGYESSPRMEHHGHVGLPVNRPDQQPRGCYDYSRTNSSDESSSSLLERSYGEPCTPVHAPGHYPAPSCYYNEQHTGSFPTYYQQQQHAPTQYPREHPTHHHTAERYESYYSGLQPVHQPSHYAGSPPPPHPVESRSPVLSSVQSYGSYYREDSGRVPPSPQLQPAPVVQQQHPQQQQQPQQQQVWSSVPTVVSTRGDSSYDTKSLESQEEQQQTVQRARSSSIPSLAEAQVDDTTDYSNSSSWYHQPNSSSSPSGDESIVPIDFGTAPSFQNLMQELDEENGDIWNWLDEM